MGTAVAPLLSAALASAQQTPQRTAQPLHAESSSKSRAGSPASVSCCARLRARSKSWATSAWRQLSRWKAWRVGEDLRRNPLYSLTVTGDEGHMIDNALFVVERG
jgi:hypothetical protein